MQALTYLTEDEGRDFIHLLRNKKRLQVLDHHYSGAYEAKLAKQVEDERFNQKNRYRLET